MMVMGWRWVRDEGLFVPKAKNSHPELGRRNLGGWELPTGLLVQKSPDFSLPK